MDSILNFVTSFWYYPVGFVIVLTILVAVHEYGHFQVARWCGVKVETFSIGFGKELFGWNDRHGTRWRFAAIPMGGYVKMFGDSDPASAGADEKVKEFTDEQKKQSFIYKSLPQKAAIVVAGPVVNFLFAIVVYVGIFLTLGQPYLPPRVGEVLKDSPAEAAGFLAGDLIVEIDGTPIDRFEQVQRMVSINLSRGAMQVVVERDGQRVLLVPKPDVVTDSGKLGRHAKGQLGIAVSGQYQVLDYHNPVKALGDAVERTWVASITILTTVGQFLTGERSIVELGGILRIGKVSGEILKDSVASTPDLGIGIAIANYLMFMSLLSINLGLFNLFPIPLLDGGHLAFYALEAVRGGPLGQKAQEYSFRIGLAVLLIIAVLALVMDLVSFELFD